MDRHLSAQPPEAGKASSTGAERLPRPHFSLQALADRPSDSPEPGILFVDLDGTLIATDLLAEALVKVVKFPPRALARVAAAGLHGRATLKQQLAELVQPDVRSLPYRSEIVEFLRQQQRLGRTIVLATASPAAWADSVAEHLGLFDAVLASEGSRNLKGADKLQAMQEYCTQAGQTEFAYMGDAMADLPIWRQAARTIVVTPSRRLRSRLAGLDAQTVRVMAEESPPWRAVWRALRPHQWAKNVLLFVPIILSHMITVSGITSALLAFVTFCLAASSVYVFNDLLDVEADRQHPTKRRRPFASGALSAALGPPLALALLATAGVIALTALPATFCALLAVYITATTLYSIWLKRIVVMDVMVLAGLYTLRILAGMEATASPQSEWLLGLSLFLFTSLAFAKRYAELSRLTDENERGPAGRGYVVADLSLIESLGPASGYLSVLVLALYINSDAMRSLYTNAWPLWLICPLFMYWITRVWFLAKRRQLSEDPVVFALKDRVSRILGGCVLILLFLASVVQ